MRWHIFVQVVKNAISDIFAMTTASPNLPSSHFPIHTHPRVWLITAATSPIGIALARRVLAHGDFVIAGIRLGEVDDDSSPRGEELREFGEDVVKEGWREKCRLVRLDGRCEELLPKRYATKHCNSSSIGAQEHQLVSGRSGTSCGSIWKSGYPVLLCK